MDETKGKLFIVYGPSGVGKSTIVREAIKRLSADYDISQVITYTCRQPRPGEVNGKDYFFISHDEFEEKRRDDFFLETNEYANKHYGSPASIIDELENGKNLILVTERLGAKNISHIIRDSILIWIEAPLKELKNRLQKRNSESSEIEKRLVIAEKEIQEEHKQRMYNYCIENEDFEQALAEFILAIKDEIINESYY